jgi:hypothetical protein
LDRSKTDTSYQHPSICDTLFGDMPISDWPRASTESAGQEPWGTFVAARSCIETGERDHAIVHLKSVTEMPGLESRHYAQAWHFLRQLGVTPPEHKAKELYGVVVEVGLDTGLEVVAAYTDLSARYLHASGSMIVWDAPDREIETAIQALLDAARPVVARIGPWEGERRPAPGKGNVRLSMLTPSGIHFGEGGMNVLSADPMGGPVIAAAAHLMSELVRKTQTQPQSS